MEKYSSNFVQFLGTYSQMFNRLSIILSVTAFFLVTIRVTFFSESTTSTFSSVPMKEDSKGNKLLRHRETRLQKASLTGVSRAQSANSDKSDRSAERISRNDLDAKALSKKTNYVDIQEWVFLQSKIT